MGIAAFRTQEGTPRATVLEITTILIWVQRNINLSVINMRPNPQFVELYSSVSILREHYTLFLTLAGIEQGHLIALVQNPTAAFRAPDRLSYRDQM